MKKNLLCVKIVVIALVMLLTNFTAFAKWEMLHQQSGAYGLHITKGGNMLLTDLVFDGSGGIYLSLDKGATWSKTDIVDKQFGEFCEVGNYVFVCGNHGYIARSDDEGKTWETIFYGAVFNGIIEDSKIESASCYAIEYFDNKLFIGDTYGGVIYSEDFGETWKLTDRESMMYQAGSNRYMDYIYTLKAYNDDLYALCALNVFKYDKANNSWILSYDSAEYLAEATVFDGVLYCARSVQYYDYSFPFLETTTDGMTWESIGHPEEEPDINISTITSDDKFIYVGMGDRGVYVTSDKGTTWVACKDGLPYLMDYSTDFYLTAHEFAFDDEYIYVTMYDYSNSGSGIYRMSRDELNTESYISDISDESVNVVNTTYFDLSGRKVASPHAGVYIKVDMLRNGSSNTAKIVVK